MSQLPSGSEFHRHNYSFAMDDLSQVGLARRFAQTMSSHLELDDVHQGRISIIVNELGNNLVKYASKGKLLFRILSGGTVGLEILSIDSGPGFENVDRALADGFTTRSTPGTGLGAVSRQADLFDIYSVVGQGTVILAHVFEESVKPAPKYRVGALNIPIKGETVCGDAWSIRLAGDKMSAIMIDGLGHGVNANAAATQAISVFENSKSTDPKDLIVSIHQSLKSTRGGAVFLIDTNDGEKIEFTGVGNIRSLIIYPEKMRSLISQNGTAGVQMRTTRILDQRWEKYGVIVMHSDGITSRWTLDGYRGLLARHPGLIAAVIFRDFNRESDDSSVMVIARSN